MNTLREFAAGSIRAGSLRADLAWTLAANMIYAGCQWGMLMVLAKFASSEAVGQVSLGLAISTPILMLASLQLRTIQATDARHEYRFEDYFALRVLALFPALGSIALIVALGGYSAVTGAVVLVVTAAKAIELLSDVVYGFLQQHERLDQVAVSTILRGVLAVASLALGVVLSGNVLVGCAVWALSWVILFAAYDLRRLQQLRRDLPGTPGPSGRQPVRATTLLRLARASAPLGVVTLLLALYTSIPRYLVDRALGAEALGIFAAIAYIERVGTTAVTALGQSASTRLARFYAVGDRYAFGRLALRLAAFGALLGAGGIMLALAGGTPLLTLLYQADYARADVLFWVMVSAGLWYLASLFGYATTAARVIRPQPLVLAGGVLALLTLGPVLIQLDGMRGAAISMALASGGTAGLYGLLLWRAIQRLPHRPGLEIEQDAE